MKARWPAEPKLEAIEISGNNLALLTKRRKFTYWIVRKEDEELFSAISALVNIMIHIRNYVGMLKPSHVIYFRQGNPLIFHAVANNLLQGKFLPCSFFFHKVYSTEAPDKTNAILNQTFAITVIRT